MQLVGGRVAFGVRCVAAGQRAVEGGGSDGVEVVAELDREGTGLDQRQGASGVPDDVGVGGEVHAAVDWSVVGSLAEHVGDVTRSHPTVAVPLGAPVGEPYAVHHALAGEPVVGGRLGRGDGVGPVA